MTNVERYRRDRERNRENYMTLASAMPREIVEEFTRIAKNLNISKAELIRRAVTFYMEEGGETKYPPG